ncbi:anion permease [Bacillus rubiinfantis]|uniref:anion permease n=1 Tax=Bacillus rubiinfantis TaxID=1499680 RepID=UPI0005A778F2|nr:anion permease [Bacillus rubiinfantis]
MLALKKNNYQEAVIGVESLKEKSSTNLVPLLITIAIGAAFWIIPAPSGLEVNAWHLLGIFIATIFGVISKPLPMGAICIVAITITVLTGTLKLEEALSGFSNSTIWLIVCAFLISRGFVKTGLGNRIAYLFVRQFGKKTLGLSYSLVATDLVLSPAMPSATARCGGIVFPIIRSLSDAFGSRVEDGTERKVGSFLTLVSFQGNPVTSALFLTAMAGNPLIVSMAKDIIGVEITWMGWFTAAVVPALISLLVIPYLIYKIYPPEIKETPKAHDIAKEKLKEMGPLKKHEWYMIGVFALILVLWIFGEGFGISATATGLIGLSVLLLSGVLNWEDVKSEKGAWDTLIWFAALVMMATFLNTLGFIPWFSEKMAGGVSGYSWVAAVTILVLVYFYSHYLFASATAHISAMYPAFLAVCVAAGAPGMLAALLLAFVSNLFYCTTHYGGGPSPVLFGAGYVSQNKWWSIGFIISLVHLVIWGVIGGIWWKVLGLW